ncbi:MAG: SpoIIIAH-like family protein [Clostridia bacterium]|nr:SpoIIIAH-like family protein [Clostridia bacterium]
MAKISFKSKILSRAGKRGLVIFCAVLLIGVAVYLNYHWFYGDEGPTYGDGNMVDGGAGDGDGTVNVSTYFSATQLARKEARDEALEVLQGVLENEEAVEATKQEAMAKMSRIAEDIQNEATVESLVKAKGFENCVAVISGEKINVIVSSPEELVASQVAQINEIVYETTGILPVNVKIMQK